MAVHFSLMFLFGLLGNAISCMVCLAPLPTFYQIWKKKTSQGFQSIPYVIGLFSAMLWLFYALFAKDAMLLITINVFTFFMQTFYIAVYLFYATIVVQRKVIKTKSVEFMPISLSFFLTLSAVMWFMYGFLKKDPYVAVPNILGFTFGILQMILYLIYRKTTPDSAAAALPVKKEADAAKVMVIDMAKLGEQQQQQQANQNNQVFPVDDPAAAVPRQEEQRKEQLNNMKKDVSFTNGIAVV
ncbi:unnamed protein product [Linum tenue]|uniref:Bidirectional sugar transporter SWEET n=1 Tax=Linum tenue TaxID=586396 RepID=A0AAV0RV43_9ROSI|nr:unnamed protein product [Linum tenue]